MDLDKRSFSKQDPTWLTSPGTMRMYVLIRNTADRYTRDHNLLHRIGYLSDLKLTWEG